MSSPDNYISQYLDSYLFIANIQGDVSKLQVLCPQLTMWFLAEELLVLNIIY